MMKVICIKQYPTNTSKKKFIKWSEAEQRKKVLLIKNKRYGKKQKPRNTENQQKFFLIRKYPLLKDLATRKLLKSN